MTGMYASFFDELEKIAATRYEREIAAGNITRGQITPGIPGIYPQMYQRQITRQQLAAPAERSAEELAKKRSLAQKQFDATMRTGSGNLRGPAGSTIPIKIHPSEIAYTLAPAMESKAVPPATGSKVLPQILMSENAPKIVEMSAHPIKSLPRHIATKVGIPAPTRPAMPYDPTIRNAAMQHEMGEAAESIRGLSGKEITPHSTHLGPEPILRENLALRGDPQAAQLFSELRHTHPSDVRVQNLIKNVGGTHDSPIPVGGRQHRAIQKQLAAKSIAADRMKQTTHALATGYKSTGMPQHVVDALNRAKKIGPELKAAVANKNISQIATKAKEILPSVGRSLRYSFLGR